MDAHVQRKWKDLYFYFGIHVQGFLESHKKLNLDTNDNLEQSKNLNYIQEDIKGILDLKNAC